MKNKLNNLIVLALVSMLFVACSKDDSNNNSNNNSSADQIANIAQSGTWRITNFIDSGQNETGDFAGYNFNFQANGTLVASNGNITHTGTWSVRDNSGSSSSSDDDFNIFFPVPNDHDFEDLNDDWDIVSVTNNRIELTDVSGGNGGVDFLTFTKN